jgi:dihydroorotate dehydrogenase (fumarate)
MASTATRIGKVELASFVFNAIGPKDVTLDELRVIGKSSAAAIATKSCTPLPRDGNEEPRYRDLELGSINSMGLPNLGVDAYVELSHTIKEEFPDKPLIVGAAGIGFEDFPVVVEKLQKSAADMLEVNLSCPNVKGKPQIAYDFASMDKTLKTVMSIGDKPIGVKLPPYFDFVHFEQAAEVLSKYDLEFLCCVNSIGNALVIDPETEAPVIRPKGGFGGLGGKYLKPTALANVRKFYELLGDRFAIIGVGGVYTGSDAFEFLLAGASAVQVGTVFMQEGPKCFERIDKELAEILKRKKYASVEDAKGKLKML